MNHFGYGLSQCETTLKCKAFSYWLSPFPEWPLYCVNREPRVPCWHHDDVIKWKRFQRYWSFVRGIPGLRWIPRTKPWRGAFMFSLICAWINCWVNNREAGDLRRYHPNYDVIVKMMLVYKTIITIGSLKKRRRIVNQAYSHEYIYIWKNHIP